MNREQDWYKQLKAAVDRDLDELVRERDKLREVGAWIIKEWLEEKANATSPDLDQAISAMRDLLDKKP